MIWGIIFAPLHWLLAARGQLFVWIPVWIGAGIALWFALPFEPGMAHYAVLALLFCAGIGGAIWAHDLARALFVILACLTAGGLAAGARVHLIAAPMIEFHYYGPVMGRVIDIDRSQSDALRITLDRITLSDVAPNRTPAKVRISLQALKNLLITEASTEFMPEPGQIVMLTAHLSAPEGPAEPGGFDFRQMAFFDGLGAVGYTRSPVVLWAEPAAGDARINRLRQYLSAKLMAAVPNDAGAFASGAMTGDRSGISHDTVLALRSSNLAHLLAISGMNLAFLSGFVFMLVRYGVALIPPLALRVNSKKIAAVLALAVALFYLLLSGANVSTTRAFLMITVMLGAILLDLRGLTMRSVAISAIVLLIVQPESLLSAGFQLSYAATVVLIGGYTILDRQILKERLPRWIMPLFTLVFTSVLAGVATAPFAAAHFNRFTDYGLLANLLTVPVMSVLMGAGAVAALLAPIGLAAPAVWVMAQSSTWILFIAHWVSGLNGAVTAIVAPSWAVLPLITFGGIWILVWTGRLRLFGLPVIAAALALWSVSPRPILLISADGRLAGLMGDQGRALSSHTGAGFSAESWLQDDGDLALQADAALRAGFSGPQTARAFEIGGISAVILTGKSAPAGYAAACAQFDLVILPATLDTGALDTGTLDPGALNQANTKGGPCTRIDRAVLAQTGALSGEITASGLILHPARDAVRNWNSPQEYHAPILIRKRPPQDAAPSSSNQ